MEWVTAIVAVVAVIVAIAGAFVAVWAALIGREALSVGGEALDVSREVQQEAIRERLRGDARHRLDCMHDLLAGVDRVLEQRLREPRVVIDYENVQQRLRTLLAESALRDELPRTKEFTELAVNGQEDRFRTLHPEVRKELLAALEDESYRAYARESIR